MEGRWDAIRTHVSRHWDLGALVAIVVLGVGLRGFGLQRWSLTLDEIFTVGYRSQAELGTLLADPYDPHPPLYYLVVRIWSVLFGASPTAIRLLSVVLSIVAIIGIYGLTRTLYNRRSGVIAALLVAVAPVHVHFGWMARMYALLVVMTVLSLYFCVRLDEPGFVNDVGYVLTTTGLLYTHVFGVFVVLGQNIYALAVGDSGWFRVPRWRWVGLQALVGIFWLPWGIVLLEQVLGLVSGNGTGGVPIDWIPSPSIWLVFETVLFVAGNPNYYPILAGSVWTLIGAILVVILFGIALFALVVDDVWSSPENRQKATFLGILLVTPIIAPLLLSVILAPIYFPRFTIAATVPLIVLVGRGIDRMPIDWFRVGVLILLILLAIGQISVYYAEPTQEPFQESTAFIADRETDETLVVAQPSWLLGDVGHFDYYYDGSAELLGAPGGEMTSEERRALRTRVEESGHVCLFQFQPDDHSADVRETISSTAGPTDRFSQGVIDVTCFRE